MESKKFNISIMPVARKSNIYYWKDCRLTLITPSLIRVEQSISNKFLDEATQSIWFRDLYDVKFTAEERSNSLVVKTEKLQLVLNAQDVLGSYIIFNNQTKKIVLRSQQNLGGTVRTLDTIAGAIELGDGVVSKNGVAIIDDSSSLVLTADSQILERTEEELDIYIFAYGNDYRAAVSALYDITGKSPMIPRYALGNWWSRYWAYTDKEYIDLLDKFEDKGIPISVATVDMDWHHVDVEKTFNLTESGLCDKQIYGNNTGWTGYSWNKELFPDYKKFLSTLRERGYRTTLNLHPADGIRWFEDCYDDMCSAMGIDATTKHVIEFDISNKKFVEEYFKNIITPYECDGVDFWWIDWQQGTKSKKAGLDPLWALNHYHYLDNGGNNTRPMILSRYAGIGSHRYPLGFSGDTHANWDILNFISYFTATSANVGYTLWSHDIGGHMGGIKNDELYIRWLQYGVFNPIMRLHSTCNPLMGKEPWNFYKGTELLASQQLQLRNRLVPYIYSEYYKNYSENRALIEPMYYAYPNNNESYDVPNQYMFGEQLLVSPITKPAEKVMNSAKVKVWLPEGQWFDIFNGYIYNGGQSIDMYRDIESIPVLAKGGTILPMRSSTSKTLENPKDMDIMVFSGNGEYCLYEDDGYDNGYASGKYCKTKFVVISDANSEKLTINKCEGDISVVPKVRKYTLKFKDITSGDVIVTINGKPAQFTVKSLYCYEVIVDNVMPTDEVIVSIANCVFVTRQNQYKSLFTNILIKYNADNEAKAKIYYELEKCTTASELLIKVLESKLPKIVKSMLSEVLDK